MTKSQFDNIKTVNVKKYQKPTNNRQYSLFDYIDIQLNKKDSDISKQKIDVPKCQCATILE
tara:strand:- start:106 stop:288 length:183 start_codon:yes stop_codon:yes gene_type:complete